MEYALLPDDILRLTFSYKPPCALKLFLQGNQEYAYLFHDQSHLENLAKDYGLPYFKDITLEQLCEFEKMKKNDLLIKAIELEDIRVIEFILQPNKFKISHSTIAKAAKIAGSHGNISIIELLNNYVLNVLHNTNKTILILALSEAVINGRTEAVKWILNEKKLKIKQTTNQLLAEEAVNRGYIEILKLFLEQGEIDINKIFVKAAHVGSSDIIQLILDYNATDIEGAMAGAVDYNHALKAAVLGKSKEAIVLLINAGATNIDEVYNFAKDKNFTDIVNLLDEYRI